MKNPLKTYEKRKQVYSDLLKKQGRRMDHLSNIRLIIALVGIGNIIYFYMIKSTFIYYILPIYILLFIYLVVKHNRLKDHHKYLYIYHEINEKALERFNGNWNKFKDTGLEFQEDHHPFSGDLDIFGQGSLFQYINTTTTYMGRQTLKKYLTEPSKNMEQINKRQEAVAELADKLAFRQRLTAEGLITPDRSDDNEDLYDFFKTKVEIYTKPWLIIGVRLFPVISIGFILLYFLEIVSYRIPFLTVLIQILIFRYQLKVRSNILDLVYKHEDGIKTYSKILYQIEKNHFKSNYLIELKDRLQDGSNTKAFEQIKRLGRIADQISNRSNIYFIPINVITLWDYQCMVALEDWKNQSGSLIETWLDTIGTFEALSSLANLRYDHPDWCFPKIVDQPYYIMAKDMGHPLITEDRVCNDFKIEDPTKVLLITGSNMSGKSTYLRTAGINMVLAYAGAPVCAKEFYCNIFSIYTCMRVSDNLEKNTSSFYAELLRIKKIVDESKINNVFFLLDEVFKGTNSQDRHEGAKLLIKKLLDNKAIGLVSTHDLELGVLEKESDNKIKNYHFKEYYENNEIFFDYRLNQGVSNTKNALYLIGMIGIDDI